MSAAFFLFIFSAPGSAQGRPVDETPCAERPSARRIKNIDRQQLADHALWIDSKGKDGRRLDLSCTFVEDADWSGLNLRMANLSQAKLIRVDLSFANLEGVNLGAAKLIDVMLSGANLKDADLTDAVLKGAWLNSASLVGASLINTNLSDAFLFEADFSNAILDKTHLDRAKLINTRLDDISIVNAELSEVVFEPETLPPPKEMASANNLEKLTYENNPSALTQLRKQFADSGFGEKDRQIIYALNRRKAKDSSWGWLKWILFDLTCQYGMSPGRALGIWAILWAASSLLYAFALLFSTEVGGSNWRHALRTALLFSTMCAVRLGFREFDWGNWVQLLMPRPYKLEGVGWIRTTAGIQSLLSLYLLGLAALSYFGRPFAE